ncbi:MAG: hypothetical protein COA43_03470 [Robiginitomaculum sp.]|nr:MAG: hypothetical protein COA43_03470 [Robiginitomaculum sp.]
MSDQQASSSIMGVITKNLRTILIGLIVISFAMWGVADAFSPKTRDAAVMVGKEKVTLVEFDKFFSQRLKEENQKSTDRISSKQAYARGFHNVVIGQLVTEALIQIDADDLGIDVNRRDARKFVESMEVFNNVITGELDEVKMMQRLSRENETRKQYEKRLYKALRQTQTLSSITTGIVAPLGYADQQYKFMTEERTLNILHLTREAVEIPADPNDEELKTFIAENNRAYIAPEYRKFTLLRVEVADLRNDMEVTDEEIKEQFDYKVEVGQLGAPETRSLTQIVSADKETADKMTAEINDGTSIDDAIANHNLESPVTYENILEDATVDPKTGEAAFTQKQNVAHTLEGSFGTWYTIIVTNINVASVPSLEAQRVTILNELKTEKAQKIIYDAQDKLQDALAEGDSIEEAAKANGISAASYDYIDRLGKNEAGAPMVGINDLVGVSQAELVLKEIFTSDIGFEGDVFETKSKGLAAVRVDAIKDSTQRPFAEIKEQALAAWRLTETDKALAALQTTLATRFAAGESLETLAAGIAKGATVEEQSVVRLGRGVRTLAPETNARLFEARLDETVRGKGANGLDRIISKVINIEPNSEVLIGAIASSLKDQTQNAINSDIQQAYRLAMLKANPALTLEENIKKILGVDQ